MSWRLMVIDGADAKRTFALPTSGAIVIGKGPAHNGITLNDFYVEKSHCKIEPAEEGIVLTDLSHERGIYINGTKIHGKHTMKDGDVLRVGNSYLKLEPHDGVAPEPPDEETDIHATPTVTPNRLVDLQGATLGHFEIGTVLGRGHHGIVFRATDKNLDQRVALKVLSPEFPSNVAELKRFASAISSLAQLEHPNLVTWYGAGRSGKYAWISEHLIDGENLNAQFSLPETARSTWRAGWRLARDIAVALEFLHQKHAHHGNITAANILFASDGSVKLNDLRFHEALQGSALEKRVMEKKLLAELPYIPPERLQTGIFSDPHVGDIYSLGVAAYVRLNGGRPPFAGDTPDEIIEQIQAGIPDKPRRRIHGVPDGLLRIIIKMLAHDQENRYQTATELLEDLKQYDDGT